VIREVVREAWSQSPAQVIATVLLAPVAVVLVWALTVFAILAGTPA
jgi:hypothetical protein